jgi:proteic killer suppression protein
MHVARRATLQPVIVSFRHKGLDEFYKTGKAQGIQTGHAAKQTHILAALDAASRPAELTLPSFNLHRLKGDVDSFQSPWVNGNWRVTFRFIGVDVELVDYQDYD